VLAANAPVWGLGEDSPNREKTHRGARIPFGGLVGQGALQVL
jgi:hypothetical protein